MPTGALTAKSQESPWLLKMDIVGNQTQLIAQGPNENVMRFKILCDRVGNEGARRRAPGGRQSHFLRRWLQRKLPASHVVAG